MTHEPDFGNLLISYECKLTAHEFQYSLNSLYLHSAGKETEKETGKHHQSWNKIMLLRMNSRASNIYYFQKNVF